MAKYKISDKRKKPKIKEKYKTKDGRIRMTVTIDEKMHANLKDIAKGNGITLSYLIEDALNEYFGDKIKK